MEPKENRASKELVLPSSVVSSIDINRLLREMEALEEFIAQSKARHGGNKTLPPRTSRLLEELADNNQLHLLQDEDRRQIQSFLKDLQQAPTIHISFSADPSAAFTQKIVIWLRENIHKHLLLQIGLQPTIAAGCIVRTDNKVFDFSLRQNFVNKKQLLIDALNGGGHE